MAAQPKQEMSGAGAMVVAAMCFGLLIAVVTLCILAVQGKEVPTQLEVLLGALVTGVPAMLARTKADPPAATLESPAPVEIVQDEPVETREVGPADGVGGADPGADVPEALSRRTRRMRPDG